MSAAWSKIPPGYRRIAAAGAICALVALALVAIGLLRSTSPAPLESASTPPPAQDEALILVARFDDRSEGQHAGVAPEDLIQQRLVARARSERLPVHVERLGEVVDEYTLDAAVAAYTATIVLWGWYDDVQVLPFVQQVATAQAGARSTALFCALDRSRVETQVAHLATYTLSVYAYGQGRAGKALEYLDGNLDDGDLACGAIPNLRGLAYRALGRNQEALTEFSRALAIESENATFYENRGDTFTQMGEHNAALGDYRRAFELSMDVVRLFD